MKWEDEIDFSLRQLIFITYESNYFRIKTLEGQLTIENIDRIVSYVMNNELMVLKKANQELEETYSWLVEQFNEKYENKLN